MRRRPTEGQLALARRLASGAPTEGDAVIKYRIYTRDEFGRLTPTQEQPHDSMAQARARVKELVKQTPAPAHAWDSGNVEYVVQGEKVRDDGGPLIVGRRELVSRLVVYRVTVVEPKHAAPPVTGWEIYGVTPD